MTFSDKRVAEAINKSYVAAWINRGPGFQNMDFSTEKWIFQGDLEAYPTKNICTFFLTPEGKVYYYVAGSYSPDVFLKVLETADALRDVSGEGAKRMHAQKAEEFEELRERAQEAAKGPDGWKALFRGAKAPAPAYRGLKHVHSSRCASSLAEGYEYFASLHRTLATWDAPAEFEAVRYTYAYGNDFTEESADATRIARGEPPPPPPPPAQPKAKRTSGQLGGDSLGLGLPGFSLGVLGQ